MRRAVRMLVVASVATLALVAMAGVAHAHANLLSSDPAGGSTVQTAPTQLTLNYSEEPDPQLSHVELLNGSGATVDTGAPTLQGQKTLVVPITGDMPDGVYTVSWSAVSVDDGHTTTDSFSFGVGVKAPPPGPAAAAPPTASGPTVLGVAGKALLYAGLMLVVAVAVVGEGVFGGAPKARPGSQPGPASPPSSGRSACCSHRSEARTPRCEGSSAHRSRARRSRWSLCASSRRSSRSSRRAGLGDGCPGRPASPRRSRWPFAPTAGTPPRRPRRCSARSSSGST